MNEEDIVRALDGVFGRPHRAMAGKPQELHGLLRKQVQPAIVSLRWNGGLHAVLYSHTRDGWIYLKEPNDGVPEATPRGPSFERSDEQGSDVRMKVDEFEEHLVTAYLPIPRLSGFPWFRSKQ